MNRRQRHAQIVVGARVARVQLDRPAKLLDRPVRIAQLRQSDTEVDVGGREARLDSDGLSVMVCGILDAAALQVQIAQPVAKSG